MSATELLTADLQVNEIHTVYYYKAHISYIKLSLQM